MNQQNQQSTFAKWSFERLQQAYLYVFAELATALDEGTEAQLSDERMTEMHMAWGETLAVARWTFKQWDRAADRAERYAA